ncbi:hypothetical protein NDU88_001969 [Pleurodeles waltl]|uniref:Uncharacterized protein n=1 Tax=Pleurodeles waltl TaxID=8319 RepID=A0AAV7LEB3_PLEWA|nr:hypothetical protein NDU88_001969 [Pleurodeles waltl]
MTPSRKQGADCEGKTLTDAVSQGRDFLLDRQQDSGALVVPETVVLKGEKELSRSSMDTETYTLPEGNSQLGLKEQVSSALSQASQEPICISEDSTGNSAQMAQAFSQGLGGIITAREKGTEGPKDGGDKPYSLTEDSDSTSSDQGSSGSRDSISSESVSFLSLTESTVRQRRRKSKGPALSGDGVEPAAQTRKARKWDYSGTNLMSTVEAHKSEAQDNAVKRVDEMVCGSAPSISVRHTDSEMLQSIYDSIKELQTETRAESRRARMATKHLQGTVHKVVKSCAEIEGKLISIGERTTVVEGEIEAIRVQTTTHEGQLADIMWKLEDQENRQRRNNLGFLGIREEAEGSNIRAYMIKTLQEAFPELTNWDWEAEVQRVHRYPVIRLEGRREENKH